MMSNNHGSEASTSPKGQQATRLFQEAYDRVGLTPERAQILNQNREFSQVLRRAIELCSMPIQAPEGGKVHSYVVPVDLGRDWGLAVAAAAPETRWGKNDVWQHREENPSSIKGGRIEEHEVVLVNFGRMLPQLAYAAVWGAACGLRPASERLVLALAEHKQYLNRMLGMPGMGVLSPTYINNSTVEIWWYPDGQRVEASLALLEMNNHLLEDRWYAFERN